MKRLFLVALVIFISITMAACGPGKLFGPTFTPTPTITLTPTTTPTLTPTLSPTPTLTPSPTPTPIGGSGQLLVGGSYCDSPNSCTRGIFSYNISTHQTAHNFDNYTLEGLSSDGSKLLVSQLKRGADVYNSVGKLYITNLDGSNPVLLSTNFSHSNIGGYLSAYWFSDSDLIAFRVNSNQKTQLYVSHPDGTLEQISKSTIGVVDFLPALSDGGIYWAGSRGWQWTKLDGTGTKIFLQNSGKLAISPNGEYIAYLYYNPFIKRGTLTLEFDISRTDGSSTVKIALSDMVENSSAKFPPMVDSYFWFPDSQRILVQIALCNPECDTYRHFILSASGELLGEINIERFDFEGGSWSPDGRQYIFMTSVKKGENYVLAPKVLDIETMQIQDIDSNLTSYRIFWLP